ncbi:hypothetical protein ACRALDRAFT_2033445 [Sodiomyces alcalophilus JCM 7366]|uniref:uncharacterized protein n=1 Tax=Sodiomyces alcalophilus JCM 7366 TaxID=591952 RepID=UPI0039B39F4A
MAKKGTVRHTKWAGRRHPSLMKAVAGLSSKIYSQSHVHTCDKEPPETWGSLFERPCMIRDDRPGTSAMRRLWVKCPNLPLLDLFREMAQARSGP